MLKYHLYEIIIRFIYLFVSLFISLLILFIHIEDLIYWLFNVALIYNDPFLILINKLQISFIISFQMNFLFFIYNLYCFFSQGLKRKESCQLKTYLKNYVFFYLFIFINIILLYYFFILQFSYFEHLYYNVNYLLKTLKIIICINILLPLIKIEKLNYILVYFIIVNILFSFFFDSVNILFISFYIFLFLEIYKFLKVSKGFVA